MTVFSIQEAARFARLSTVTIRRLIDRGELPVVEAGRRTLILRDDLEAWVQSKRVTRKPAATA